MDRLDIGSLRRRHRSSRARLHPVLLAASDENEPARFARCRKCSGESSAMQDCRCTTSEVLAGYAHSPSSGLRAWSVQRRIDPTEYSIDLSQRDLVAKQEARGINLTYDKAILMHVFNSLRQCPGALVKVYNRQFK